MAKAKGTPGLRAALAQTRKLGRQMNREATADYRVAMSASKAGSANLRNQLGRIDREVRVAMKNDQKFLGSLSAEARAGQRAVRNREAGAVRAYGGALAGSVRESFGPAGVRAEGNVVKGAAAERQGLGQMSVQATVGQLAMAAAGAQDSAAGYMLNQALMARNMISAETVAQLQGDLYKSAMQYNMEWAMWKKQQDYARKQAEKEAGPGARNVVDRLVDEGADISVGAAEAWRKHRDEAMAAGEDPNATANISTMAQEWAAANGYAVDSDEVKVFIATMQQLKNSPEGKLDTGKAYANAIERLYSDAPGWDKWGQAALDAGTRKIHTSLIEALQAYKDEQDGVLSPTDDPNFNYTDGSPTGAGNVGRSGRPY